MNFHLNYFDVDEDRAAFITIMDKEGKLIYNRKKYTILFFSGEKVVYKLLQRITGERLEKTSQVTIQPVTLMAFDILHA